RSVGIGADPAGPGPGRTGSGERADPAAMRVESDARRGVVAVRAGAVGAGAADPLRGRYAGRAASRKSRAGGLSDRSGGGGAEPRQFIPEAGASGHHRQPYRRENAPFFHGSAASRVAAGAGGG